MTRTLALSANAAALMATLFLSVSDASATVTFNGRVQVRGPMGGLIRYHAAAWRQPSHLPPSHSRFSFSVENTTASTVKFVVCYMQGLKKPAIDHNYVTIEKTGGAWVCSDPIDAFQPRVG